MYRCDLRNSGGDFFEIQEEIFLVETFQDAKSKNSTKNEELTCFSDRKHATNSRMGLERVNISGNVVVHGPCRALQVSACSLFTDVCTLKRSENHRCQNQNHRN